MKTAPSIAPTVLRILPLCLATLGLAALGLATLGLAALAASPAAWAQQSERDGLVHDATAFRLAADTPEGLWVELTPLTTSHSNLLSRPTAQEPDSRLFRPAVLLPEDSQPGLTWLPERAAGPAMLCRGVDPAIPQSEDDRPILWAVACELIAVWRDDPESLLPPPDDPVVEVTASAGPAVAGRYLLGDLPIEGVVISVTPARLDAPVPFTLPLRWTGSHLERSLRTSEDGTFRLPRLAPGDYVLEARLPGGRLHRTDTFAVPEVAELQTNSGTLDLEELTYDLGDLEVGVGVRLEVHAFGSDAGLLRGVDVDLRQGRTAADLATFQARTGDDGIAYLDDLTVDSPSVLTCSAPGLATVRHEWDLLPVTIDCDMEPLAALAGEVFDPQAQPVPGAVVRLTPTDEAGRDRPLPRETAPGDDGSFLFADCGAGAWMLRAAAPGFRVEEVSVTLDAGDRVLLDPIYLRPGREVLVRVAGPDGEPVPGAEITAVDPAGSVAATADTDGEALFAHPGPETVVEVTGLEYAPERLRIPAEQSGADGAAARGPFDVTLRPGGWIRVLVGLGAAIPEGSDITVDSADAWRPCAGCEVWIDSPGSARRRLVTDGRGEAVSPPLHPGVHRVERSRLTQAGRVVVEGPKAEERTVRVTEGEITTVRFSSDADVLTVRFRPAPDPELGPWSLIVQQGNARKIVPAESDGSFRVDAPTTLGLPISLSILRFDPTSGADAWTRVAQMTSWPADNEELDLVLPQGRVEGRTLRTDTSASDAPAAAARVRLIDFHDFTEIAELRTAPDGSFAIPYLAPGVYSLQIRDIIYTYVSLRPGQSIDVGALRLAPGIP